MNTVEYRCFWSDYSFVIFVFKYKIYRFHRHHHSPFQSAKSFVRPRQVKISLSAHPGRVQLLRYAQLPMAILDGFTIFAPIHVPLVEIAK